MQISDYTEVRKTENTRVRVRIERDHQLRFFHA